MCILHVRLCTITYHYYSQKYWKLVQSAANFESHWTMHRRDIQCSSLDDVHRECNSLINVLHRLHKQSNRVWLAACFVVEVHLQSKEKIPLWIKLALIEFFWMLFNDHTSPITNQADANTFVVIQWSVCTDSIETSTLIHFSSCTNSETTIIILD